MSDDRKQLETIWKALFRTDPPPEQSWVLWEARNTSADIREAILQLGLKHRQTNGQMEPDYMVKFVSSVLGRIGRQKRAAITQLKVWPDRPLLDDDADARWNR